jgi:formylmethanofuran dehydrogenase subunit E
MAAKAIERNNKILCQDCADSSYFQLEGSGIIKKVNKL